MLVLSVAALLGSPGGAAADSGATLRIDPPSVKVDGGETFTLNIVQSAPVPTTGAQTNVVFNPVFVHVVDVKPGPAYSAGVFVFGSADDGSSGSVEAAIAKANETGILANVAAFLLPGSGSVPPGDAVFLTLTLQAQHGGGGSTALVLRGAPGLNNVAMLDANGAELAVTTTQGMVVVAASAGGASQSATPAGVASPTPGAGGGGATGASGTPSGPADVYVAPTSIQLQAGMPARVFFVARTAGPVSSIAADLAFEKDKLEITGIEPGPAWSEATIVAGDAGRTPDQAIADANATGVLKQAGVFLLPGASDLPSGEGVFLSVMVKGKVDGTSTLALSGATVLDAQGGPVLLSSPVPGSGPALAGSGGGFDPTGLVALAVVLALLAGGTWLIRSGAIPARRLRRWPFVVSLMLGLIPVVLFVAIVVMLVVNSLPVLNDPGLPALLGDHYSSKYSGQNLGQFGLLPALWGTVLITVIAIGVALPVSLALAIVATDFPMGPLGRVVRPVVGLLSGIPPIVYAVSVLVFITAFMIPKFAANSTYAAFDPATIGAKGTWPPPDVPFNAGSFPWDLTGLSNSTLLGGMLIALLVIPFMTPLIADAMRDVSSSAREASLALGANRSYTLRKVFLPLAMPGIVGAVALGTLKALGDTLIVAFAVGWSADSIPQPLLDVLERTPSLAAQSAGLIGTFETLNDSCKPAECAVGYSSALLLLLVAGVVVLFLTYVQARGRRRVLA